MWHILEEIYASCQCCIYFQLHYFLSSSVLQRLPSVLSCLFALHYFAVLCDLYLFRLKLWWEKIKVSRVWSTVSSRSGIGSLLKDWIVYVQILMLFCRCVGVWLIRELPVCLVYWVLKYLLVALFWCMLNFWNLLMHCNSKYYVNLIFYELSVLWLC